MPTKKISISVEAKDLVVLRRLAKELSGGNLSALFVSGVAPLLEKERTKAEREARRRKFLEWLGPPPSKEESEAIAAVLEGRATKKQRAIYDRIGEEPPRRRKSA
ncbi:MAG: hypothetical protein HYV09_00390 [Deltaproteobacteria bacterium]|nr:hypothetical protein [Deltaproteobacteria bacterium]